MEVNRQEEGLEKFKCDVEAVQGQSMDSMVAWAKFLQYPDAEQLRNMEVQDIPKELNRWLTEKIIPEQSKAFPPLALFDPGKGVNQLIEDDEFWKEDILPPPEYDQILRAKLVKLEEYARVKLVESFATQLVREHVGDQTWDTIQQLKETLFKPFGPVFHEAFAMSSECYKIYNTNIPKYGLTTDHEIPEQWYTSEKSRNEAEGIRQRQTDFAKNCVSLPKGDKGRARYRSRINCRYCTSHCRVRFLLAA